jgi:dTDP-glucose 4,6-dehydratase
MNDLENNKEDFKGESCRPYNVGSEEEITIAELAHTVAQCFQKPIAIKVARMPEPGKPAERYVPSTKRVQEELCLRQIIDLSDGIKRTILCHQHDI